MLPPTFSPSVLPRTLFFMLPDMVALFGVWLAWSSIEDHALMFDFLWELFGEWRYTQTPKEIHATGYGSIVLCLLFFIQYTFISPALFIKETGCLIASLLTPFVNAIGTFPLSLLLIFVVY